MNEAWIIEDAKTRLALDQPVDVAALIAVAERVLALREELAERDELDAEGEYAVEAAHTAKHLRRLLDLIASGRLKLAAKPKRYEQETLDDAREYLASL